ncbi:MAG: serine protease [Myxococcota bacterium]
MRYLSMILLALLAYAPSANAQNMPLTPDAITVGSVVNGTSGGVIVGPPEELRSRLLLVLGERGINALPPESQDGASIDPGRSRYVLNGTVVAQSCQRESHWTGCRWRVQWSVLDRAYDRIAVETTTAAEAGVNQSNATSDMYTEIVARSLIPLARSPELKAILTEGSAEPLSDDERWKAPVQARRCAAKPTAFPAGIQSVRPSLFSYETARGRGTGALISPDGLGIASGLVLAGQDSVTVQFADATEHTATVVRLDTRSDLAVVSIPERTDTCVVLDVQAQPLGTAVHGLGTRDGGPEWGLRSGTLMGVQATPAGMQLQTDAAISDLASGSPILGPDSQMVGIGLGSRAPVASVSLMQTLRMQWSEAPALLSTVDREPAQPGPITLDLGDDGGPLEPPFGPNGTFQAWADVPGAPQIYGGAIMVGVGTLIAVPSAIAWGNEEGGFNTDPTRRATYGALTGIGLATAIGGGFLLNKGLQKNRERGATVIATGSGAAVIGTF